MFSPLDSCKSACDSHVCVLSVQSARQAIAPLYHHCPMQSHAALATRRRENGVIGIDWQTVIRFTQVKEGVMRYAILGQFLNPSPIFADVIKQVCVHLF